VKQLFLPLTVIIPRYDCKLFALITGNGQHLLYPLLPPEREHQYTLRQRSSTFNFLIAHQSSNTKTLL